MKKLLTDVAAAILEISVSGAAAFAVGGGHGRNFVDNDPVLTIGGIL